MVFGFFLALSIFCFREYAPRDQTHGFAHGNLFGTGRYPDNVFCCARSLDGPLHYLMGIGAVLDRGRRSLAGSSSRIHPSHLASDR